MLVPFPVLVPVQFPCSVTVPLVSLCLLQKLSNGTNEDPPCSELITNPAAKINDEHLSRRSASRRCLINKSRKISFPFELTQV